MSSQKTLLSVAIDFGTTYSGYAFSWSHDNEKDPTKVYAFENWPLSNRTFSKKTPTVLLLNKKKKYEAFGYEAEEMYHQLSEENKHRDWYFFRRFKMKLQGEKGIKEDMILEDETGKTMRALDVFAESIKYLKNHFLGVLKDRGVKVKDSEIQYVLTVPAIWSDFAKQFMRKAGEKAGISSNRLTMALEPEAAAIYCQHEKLEHGENEFASGQVGTKYMVIDLGGGTADIAVHEKLAKGKIKEVAKASGGPWGGTAIDEEFTKLLTRVLGGPVLHEFRQTYMHDYIEMMREFEVAKRSIKPDWRLPFRFRIPISLDTCCQNQNGEIIAKLLSGENFPFKNQISKIHDKLSIKSEIMKEIFASVTQKITDHIQEVLTSRNASDCKILLMVGGFSESAVVQKAIRDRFQTTKRKVIVPFECGTSVVKGAAMLGHTPEKGVVTARIMRYFYGMEIHPRFDSKKHDDKYSYFQNGVCYAEKVFSPFMLMGACVENGTTLTREYIYDILSAKSRVRVYSASRNIEYVDEEGCEKMLEITVLDLAEKYLGKRVDIVIQFVFGGTEIEVEVLCKQTKKSKRETVDIQV